VAVKGDQVVRGDGRQVPEHEEQYEILGHGEPDHRAHEEQDKEVEARRLEFGSPLVPQVQRYVARRVDENQEPYPGRQQRIQDS
jgi:hypothetical protein